KVDVLAACGLCLQVAAGVAAAANLQQISDLTGKGDGFSQWFCGYQGAALFLPLTAKGIQNAISPFATRRQGYSVSMAVDPGAACHFPRFVLGSQAELE